jgi:hypothetical protein
MASMPVLIEHDRDDPECALPFADGTVAGRPYRFLIDTGAARTTMAADDYTGGLPAVAVHGSHGAFGAVEETIVTVTDVCVGPMRAASLEVARTAGARPDAPCLLGMDVIGRYRCHFRFGAGAIEIGQGGDDATGGGQASLDLHTDGRGQVYLDVGWPDVPGLSGYACWDSGAGITIVHEEFWHAHRDLFTSIGTAVGTDASGKQRQTPLALMSGLVIGGRPFRPHKAAIVDLSAANATVERPMDLVLGYPTYSQADWLFDFPARRWAPTS